MKKICALILTFSLAACAVGCGSKSAGSSGQSAMDALPKDASPAQTVTADFTDKMNSGDFTSTEDLAVALAEADYLPFDGATMQVEEGWLNGFSDEITGFKDGYMFGPVIGSSPFIGYVLVVEDGGKTEDLIKTLESSADLRWNVCTQAEDMQSAAVKDTVCFVMSPASFEE